MFILGTAVYRDTYQNDFARLCDCLWINRIYLFIFASYFIISVSSKIETHILFQKKENKISLLWIKNGYYWQTPSQMISAKLLLHITWQFSSHWKLKKFRALSKKAMSNSVEVHLSALRDLQKCLFVINHFKHKVFRHVEC